MQKSTIEAWTYGAVVCHLWRRLDKVNSRTACRYAGLNCGLLPLSSLFSPFTSCFNRYVLIGAREVLEYAQAAVEEPGSCTACLAILKPKTNVLEVRLVQVQHLIRGGLYSNPELTAKDRLAVVG